MPVSSDLPSVLPPSHPGAVISLISPFGASMPTATITILLQIRENTGPGHRRHLPLPPFSPPPGHLLVFLRGVLPLPPEVLRLEAAAVAPSRSEPPGPGRLPPPSSDLTSLRFLAGVVLLPGAHTFTCAVSSWWVDASFLCNVPSSP